MIKRALPLSLLAFFLFIGVATRAQYILNEADAQYQLFNYVKAIDIYEQAYQKKNTLHAAERLASAYTFIRNYAEAESWYAIASEMEGSSPENLLGYAESLRNNSKYTEARQSYLKYLKVKKDVPVKQKELWLQSCDSALKWMQHPVPVIVNNLKELNSSSSDWGAIKINGDVIFSSDRQGYKAALKKEGKPFLKFDKGEKPDKNIYGWTGTPYLRLFKKNAEDSLQLFPLEAGTGYHVGAASFTGNGSEVYFTLTKIADKLKYDKGVATIRLEVYSSKSTENGKGWEKPSPLKFNNPKEWSVGDPYISKDGQTLYFAANFPGGAGGTDIYRVIKNKNGEWEVPINLEKINTAGNERTPVESEKGDFYFSSDGYPGMGGLDIFKSSQKAGVFSKPLNMGYPINSAQDDFAFNLYGDSEGYLSSNRLNGTGSDDIYAFNRQVIEAIKLEGKIFNKKTGQPLAEAIATLKNATGNTLQIQTDESGYYSFKIEKNIPYDVKAEKTGFTSADTSFITRVSLVKDFYLNPIELNKPIRLENIYYDFDKANIRADAAIELDKLIKILRDNPTIWIELSSHTDSRGKDQYNQWLSQSRANSAVQYIIDQGISKNRITAKGYGESRLLNRCGNGVKCSEADHQLNRRTEFTIVKQ